MCWEFLHGIIIKTKSAPVKADTTYFGRFFANTKKVKAKQMNEKIRVEGFNTSSQKVHRKRNGLNSSLD